MGRPNFGWPLVPIRVSQEYGVNGHPGIDLAVGRGTPAMAAADGKVKSAGMNSGGYGNLVILDHGDGIETYYAHLQTINVRAGDDVHAGQPVGTVDSTGNSTGDHLHFEIREGGRTTNPRAWIAGNPGAGNTVTPSSGGGGINIPGTNYDLPNPFDTASNIVGAFEGLSTFAQTLADGKTWIRLLMFGGGIVAALVGLAIATKDSWKDEAETAGKAAALAVAA